MQTAVKDKSTDLLQPLQVERCAKALTMTPHYCYRCFISRKMLHRTEIYPGFYIGFSVLKT